MSGIPCAHAITYIFFNRQDVEQYIHPCYHVSTYKDFYESIITPINGQNMQRPSGVTPVQPSIKRRPPSRLKKKRAREPNEPTRRAGISKQCKICGKLEHNRRSCKGEIGGNSSLPSTTNRTNASNKVIYGHVCEIQLQMSLSLQLIGFSPNLGLFYFTYVLFHDSHWPLHALRLVHNTSDMLAREWLALLVIS